MQAGPASYRMDYNDYCQWASMDPPSVGDTQPEAPSHGPTVWYDTCRGSSLPWPFLYDPHENARAIGTSFSRQEYNHPSPAASLAPLSASRLSPSPHKDNLTKDQATGTGEEWESWFSFHQFPDPHQFSDPAALTKGEESALNPTSTARDPTVAPFHIAPEPPIFPSSNIQDGSSGLGSWLNLQEREGGNPYEWNSAAKLPQYATAGSIEGLATHYPTQPRSSPVTTKPEGDEVAIQFTTSPHLPAIEECSRGRRAWGAACSKCRSSKVKCNPGPDASSVRGVSNIGWNVLLDRGRKKKHVPKLPKLVPKADAWDWTVLSSGQSFPRGREGTGTSHAFCVLSSYTVH